MPGPRKGKGGRGRERGEGEEEGKEEGEEREERGEREEEGKGGRLGRLMGGGGHSTFRLCVASSINSFLNTSK